MGRSARLPELEEEFESPVRQAVAAIGGAVARNPAMAGGGTAFLVALAFVSANALWYQPHFHEGAFFVTRLAAPHASAETAETGKAKPRNAVASRPAKDPLVLDVQEKLAQLRFYSGDVDGQAGPATRKAIEDYQAANGLPVSGLIDSRLRASLGVGDKTAGIAAQPVSLKEPAPERLAADASAEAEARIRKVQAGLKAFGNDGIEIDGVVGSRTRSAIREFQTLFGLPVTGEPDERLYAKMREIGLTN